MVLPLFSTAECLPKNQSRLKHFIFRKIVSYQTKILKFLVSDWYKELLDEENVTWEQIKSCSKYQLVFQIIRRLFNEQFFSENTHCTEDIDEC